MNHPTVIFDPYAAADLRNMVQTIVCNHNIAITGQAEWYPVAFFLKDENGEVLGGLLGRYLGGLVTRQNACGGTCARAWLWQGTDEACGTLCG